MDSPYISISKTCESQLNEDHTLLTLKWSIRGMRIVRPTLPREVLAATIWVLKTGYHHQYVYMHGLRGKSKRWQSLYVFDWDLTHLAYRSIGLTPNMYSMVMCPTVFTQVRLGLNTCTYAKRLNVMPALPEIARQYTPAHAAHFTIWTPSSAARAACVSELTYQIAPGQPKSFLAKCKG